MPHVITHPENGIYLGNCMGLGFWSKLDSAGQTCAVTFPTAQDAIAHIRSWDNNNDPASCAIVGVTPSGEDGYATIKDLRAAGLGDMIGDMEASSATEDPSATTPSESSLNSGP